MYARITRNVLLIRTTKWKPCKESGLRYSKKNQARTKLIHVEKETSTNKSTNILKLLLLFLPNFLFFHSKRVIPPLFQWNKRLVNIDFFAFSFSMLRKGLFGVVGSLFCATITVSATPSYKYIQWLSRYVSKNQYFISRKTLDEEKSDKIWLDWARVCV